MPARPEESSSPEQSSSVAETAEVSEALRWAISEFSFDPDERGPQRGVMNLQAWLRDRGASHVAADGLLGKQTLNALTKLYDGGSASAPPAETPRQPAPKKAARKQAAGKTAKRQTKTRDTGEKSSPEKPKSEEPEPVPPPPLPDDDAASARPVALSDSAVASIDDDRLGFRPYVEAVAEFILAAQTRPPLTIAIDAKWGKGKTSFMKMIQSQLERRAPRTTTRVATIEFNPWKYSEPEQVWAAFVDKVTRCLRSELGLWRNCAFFFTQLWLKLHRNATPVFWVSAVVTLLFLILVGASAFSNWSAIKSAFVAENGYLATMFEAADAQERDLIFYLVAALAGSLALLYVYVTFTKKLGLNLLDHIEKTDFRDKVGTLSQFDDEMRRLADAIPKNLKVVVFIDDLDRCKGPVLGELVEALQLADVSRACIFVMGMDLQIVANVIEQEREHLVHSVSSAQPHLEHGSGYKFLEKIIQAKLALPSYGEKDMRWLIATAMDAKPPAKPASSSGELTSETQGGQDPQPAGAGEQALKALARTSKAVRDFAFPKAATPADSEELKQTAAYYGSLHFSNPRRLKRFINGLRLQTYLAKAGYDGELKTDHLARFLVLSEKWPALVQHLLDEKKGAEILREANSKDTSVTMAMHIKRLPEKELACVKELLRGREGKAPLQAREIEKMATWSGFTYYRGLGT